MSCNNSNSDNLKDSETPISSQNSERDTLNSLTRQYGYISNGVLKIYDLRFKIISIYILGLLSSFAISITFNNPFGFLLATVSTAIMFSLDRNMHKRQTLFAFVAAKLEDRIKTLRKDCADQEVCCFYQMYFNYLWGMSEKDLLLHKIQTEEKGYYMKSRGYLFIAVSIAMGILTLLSVLISRRIIVI